MTEEQKLFLDKYDQSIIEYKKYYKFEIYNEK
jgi:hypothetical protein